MFKNQNMSNIQWFFTVRAAYIDFTRSHVVNSNKSRASHTSILFPLKHNIITYLPPPPVVRFDRIDKNKKKTKHDENEKQNYSHTDPYTRSL